MNEYKYILFLIAFFPPNLHEKYGNLGSLNAVVLGFIFLILDISLLKKNKTKIYIFLDIFSIILFTYSYIKSF